MKLSKQLHWALYFFFLLAACARETSPTGGPKDTIPPRLISSIPNKQQKNVKTKTVELTFNEWIALNNPKEQIIVIPDVDKKYNVVAKKNKVILTFDNALKDSSTYSLSFRESIQDITEKNPASNLKLAFSTGPYIDSLSISGFVYDPIKGKEVKDATIALYQSDTFNIFKHRPTYFTKSDEKGNYIIENLKPGIYHVYAVDDKNRNLFADSKTESYGYLVDSLPLSKNVSHIDIPVIRLDSRDIKMTSARPYNTYFNIKVTKNLQNFSVKSVDDIMISAFGEDRANIRVYNTLENKDSVQIRFTAMDSIHNKIDTTLYVKFGKRDVKKEKFDVKPQNFEVVGDKGILRGKVVFNKPLIDIRYDSIFYTIDSTKVIKLTAADFVIDSATNTLTISKTFDKSLLIKPELPKTTPATRPTAPKVATPTQPDTVKRTPQKPKKAPITNQLYFGKAAFVSIELDSSAATTQNVKPSTLEDTGYILIELKTKQPSYIVQLVDKNYTVIQEKRNTAKFQFEDLQPGDYMIRVIIDSNNNGHWDPGSFFRHEMPEKMVFYMNDKKNPVTNLKANWEVGPLLITF